MENKKQYVYLVRQTQTVDYYDERTIAVFTDKEKAYELARKLNKEYGDGCQFDDDYNFIEPGTDYDSLHYYDVDCKELNPDMNDFMWLLTKKGE